MTQNLNWIGGSDARVTRLSTQKQFRAQTRVGQRPLPRKTFETVELTGAALAVPAHVQPRTTSR